MQSCDRLSITVLVDNYIDMLMPNTATIRRQGMPEHFLPRRGTPLAEILRAQAQDARDEAKRDLLETAGKKEVGMLVPLVFLILPITIVFAIYPGIFVLQLGF